MDESLNCCDKETGEAIVVCLECYWTEAATYSKESDTSLASAEQRLYKEHDNWGGFGCTPVIVI